MSEQPVATRLRRALVAGLLGLGMAIAPLSPAVAAEPEVEIPDDALRACVQRNLEASGLPSDLTADNLAALRKLGCSATQDGVIEDLAGLSHLTRVESFGLRGHAVTDLAAIGELSTLKTLLLDVNAAAGVSFLTELNLDMLSLAATGARLPHLPALRVSRLNIIGTDLTSLAGLGEVAASRVVVSAAKLTDVSALSSATIRSLELSLGPRPVLDGLAAVSGLETLTLTSPDLTDLSGLAGQPTLHALQLHSPTLTDLTSLGSLPSLTRLSVSSSQLTSLGSPGALQHLETLDASYAKLTSIEALLGADSLMKADLSHNRISDISPLATVPDGASLNLDRNQITDFSPLAGWEGSLNAYLQQVQLPDGIAEVPFKIPFPLRDPQGQDLILSETSTARYSDGYLTFDHPSESEAAYFWNALNQEEMTIAVVLSQTVKPAREFAARRPVFTTTPQVGVRFTPQFPAWTPAPDTMAYQWFNWGIPITGATADSYVPTHADLGGPLTLRVTGKKLGYATTDVLSDYSQSVTAGRIAKTPAPTISHAGRLSTDTVLTAKPGIWDAGVTLKYQWQRDKKNITGATSATYKAKASDVGHKLRVGVTGSKPGYTAVTRYSGQVTPAKAKFAASSNPKISGTRAVGKKLTATVDWTPKATMKYQWYRNGKAIKGAAKSSYTLKAGDLGDRFKVKVTASKSGYTKLTRTSSSTAKVAKGTLAARPAIISGTPTVGKTLTAHRGTWKPGGIKFSYQWYRDAKAIKGATARTYRVRATDAGHSLSVRVTGKKAGYTTTRKTSVSVVVR